MQKRYEVRVEGIRALPFFVGSILFAVLAAGLVVLLLTVGFAAFVAGLALSAVAGIVLAVRRRLGLGGGARREEEELTEFLDAEQAREWERHRLDLGEGEIIDVEEVIEEQEQEEDGG